MLMSVQKSANAFHRLQEIFKEKKKSSFEVPKTSCGLLDALFQSMVYWEIVAFTGSPSRCGGL